MKMSVRLLLSIILFLTVPFYAANQSLLDEAIADVEAPEMSEPADLLDAEEELMIEMEDHIQPDDDFQEDVQEEAEEIFVPTQASPAEEFQEEAKREQVVKLVDQGISFLMSNPDDKSFSAFSHDKRFVLGELYLVVLDITKKNEAICLAHGQETGLIYQDLFNLKDKFGVSFVQSIVAANPAGDWVNFEWKGATEVAWVKQAKKNKRNYLFLCGYFPHSKVDAVVNLVKGAVALFNQLIAQGHPLDEAFSNFSYPIGRFVYGDLYIYALDFQGMHYAHGELPGLIGTNGWTYRDARGKLVNQSIVAKLKDKEPGVGIWDEYYSKGALKKTYAVRVVDKAGKSYFIACGYYPAADRAHVVDLVKKGYQYMKQQGVTQAAKAFSEKRNLQFKFGDLYLFVYDMKGKCIAHGRDPEFVGENQWNVQDEDGNYYIQDMIKQAEKGSGWIDAKLRNSFQSIYVEKIDMGTPDVEFVIGSGVFPISKYETMNLLARSGADYLNDNDLYPALRDFTKPGSRFIRGDLELFVFDASGICYAYGDDHDLIWRNLFNINDDDGKPFVKIIINTVKKGAGTVSFRLNGVLKTARIEPVKKDGQLFAVGSSFYH